MMNLISEMLVNLLYVCQWLLIFGFVSSLEPDHCINSRAKNGRCVHIDLCPELLSIAQKTIVSVQDNQLLRANSCGRLMVCCEQPVIETRTDKTMALPGADVCGLGHASQKIIGGKETELEQYRWMVVIELLEDGIPEVICGGSLINTLYVLTAAHCFKNVRGPESLILRVGEHDLSNDPDCDNSLNCNDPVVFAHVSQIIIHPKYSRQRNDVALLKLAAPIQYTNYILPICLPVQPHQQEQFINHRVFAAGWGSNGTGEALSQVKMHVELMITNTEECENLFSRGAPGEMHICAKSATDEVGDTCDGDSGGPLMIELGGNWFAIGIVNFGLPCGTTNPAIYARISHFMHWIQSNLME